MPNQDLEVRLAKLAVRVITEADLVEFERERVDPDIAKEWAQELSGMATECEENYVRLETSGDIPTVAQGVALARLMRGRKSAREVAVRVNQPSLPPGYLHVYFPDDDFEAGIAMDGSTSS